MRLLSGSPDMMQPPGSKPKLPPIVGKLNNILHVSIALTGLSIAFVLFDSTLFAFHPVFMSLGYLIFMAEALISAVMFRHLEGAERTRAIESHGFMQLRAITCIAIGFGVIYRNKILLGKSHFLSTHAKFGLATLVLSALMPLGGLLSFKKVGLLQKLPERLHPHVKTIHRMAGVITWFLSLATIELALAHKSVNKGVLTYVWQGGVAFIGAVMMMLMVKAVLKPKSDENVSKAV